MTNTSQNAAPTRVIGRKASRMLATEPRPFDFRRPSKFSRDHIRALQIVQDTMTRKLSMLFTSELRTHVEVEPLIIEQRSFDEYISSTPEIAYFAVVSLEPLTGPGVFHLPLPLAMVILERLLGGTRPGRVEPRPLTDIETDLIRTIVQRVMREFATAFEPLLLITPHIVSEEANQQLVQITAPSDMTVTVGFDVTIDGVTDNVGISIPFPVLQPTLEAHSSRATFGDRRRDDVEANARLVEERLGDVDVPVALRFPAVSLTSAEVLSLNTGDVIPLQHPTTSALSVWVDGVPTFRGVAGRRGRRLACQILGPENGEQP